MRSKEDTLALPVGVRCGSSANRSSCPAVGKLEGRLPHDPAAVDPRTDWFCARLRGIARSMRTFPCLMATLALAASANDPAAR